MLPTTGKMPSAGEERHVYILGYDDKPHDRSEASQFISLGYRVTNTLGKPLKFEDALDSTRKVVVDWDKHFAMAARLRYIKTLNDKYGPSAASAPDGNRVKFDISDAYYARPLSPHRGPAPSRDMSSLQANHSGESKVESKIYTQHGSSNQVWNDVPNLTHPTASRATTDTNAKSAGPIDCSRITPNVHVHGHFAGGGEPFTRGGHMAATFLRAGYRVTDAHGCELAIETKADGRQTVVARGKASGMRSCVNNHKGNEVSKDALDAACSDVACRDVKHATRDAFQVNYRGIGPEVDIHLRTVGKVGLLRPRCEAAGYLRAGFKVTDAQGCELDIQQFGGPSGISKIIQRGGDAQKPEIQGGKSGAFASKTPTQDDTSYANPLRIGTSAGTSASRLPTASPSKETRMTGSAAEAYMQYRPDPVTSRMSELAISSAAREAAREAELTRQQIAKDMLSTMIKSAFPTKQVSKLDGGKKDSAENLGSVAVMAEAIDMAKGEAEAKGLKLARAHTAAEDNVKMANVVAEKADEGAVKGTEPDEDSEWVDVGKEGEVSETAGVDDEHGAKISELLKGWRWW